MLNFVVEQRFQEWTEISRKYYHSISGTQKYNVPENEKNKKIDTFCMNFDTSKFHITLNEF